MAIFRDSIKIPSGIERKSNLATNLPDHEKMLTLQEGDDRTA
jgi:hypothetical protein